MQPANGNGHLANAKAQIAQRDKVLYIILALLFAFLSLLASNMYIRLSVVELSLRDALIVKDLRTQQLTDDHSLLMTIEAFHQQSLVIFPKVDDRLDRFDARLLAVQMAISAKGP